MLFRMPSMIDDLDCFVSHSANALTRPHQISQGSHTYYSMSIHHHTADALPSESFGNYFHLFRFSDPCGERTRCEQ